MPSREIAPVLYYARRPFSYTEDLYVDQGQVVELRGVINDEKLTRLGYFELCTGPQRSHLVQCGECGAKFITPQLRDRHGARQHRTRGESLEMSPAGAGGAYADDFGDAEERRLNQEAPLYLEKSEASQR